jgi:hypothetical protein
MCVRLSHFVPPFLLSPRVELRLTERGIEFGCFGKVSTRVTYSTGMGINSRSHTSYGGKTFMDVSFPTGTEGQWPKFAPGSVTRFPFQVQIPADAPATLLAQDVSSQAQVHFSIWAQAYVCDAPPSNMLAMVSLIVDPVASEYAREPAPNSLEPRGAAETEEVPKYMGLSCCGTQRLTLVATIPRTAFSPDDIIPIAIEVTCDRPEGFYEMAVHLARHYEVSAGGREHQFDDTVETVVVVPVNQGKSGKSVFQARLPASKLSPNLAKKDLTRSSVVVVSCYMMPGSRAVDVSSDPRNGHWHPRVGRKRSSEAPSADSHDLLSTSCLQVMLPLANPVAPGVLPSLTNTAPSAPAQQRMPLQTPLQVQPQNYAPEQQAEIEKLTSASSQTAAHQQTESTTSLLTREPSTGEATVDSVRLYM